MNAGADNTVALTHLLAALVAGRQDPRALPPDRAAELVPLARRHGLGPMLLWAVEQAGLDPAASPWSPLLVADRRQKLRYLLGVSSHQAVQSVLDAAGIPSLWLKGFALAHTVYPRPDLRPMIDLDVLVPWDRRHEALAAVNAAGYHNDALEPFPGYDDLLHHYELYGSVEDLVKLELHFRLVGLGDALLDPVELEWFWGQTRPVVWQDLRFLALAPEAHLLHLCAHAILHHGETDFQLRRYLDLHLLVTHTPAPDWALVVERAVELRWTYAVERALGYAQEYFATALPQGLLEELRQRRPRGERIALATRRQPTNHWEDLVKNLQMLTGPARWRFLLGTFFPSAAYLRAHYQVDAGWKMPLFYVRRWGFFAKEAVRTAWGRLRGA
jgi:hypothetical protein